MSIAAIFPCSSMPMNIEEYYDYPDHYPMSVEAISWALNLAPVTSPTSKLVLIALANHARPDGTAAFPSVETISRYTCLSERSVRHHLDFLEESGVIRRCDPRIVAAYIKRVDRRPIGFDLCMTSHLGVQEPHLVDERGASDAAHGVHLTSERGAGVAPEPLQEPSIENRPNKSDAEASDTIPSTTIQSPYLDDARRLCTLLSDLMIANGSRAPRITGEWIAEMDRLMRLDNRTPEQVEAAIRWAQGHAFWRSNILSPTKLRHKYDTLRLQAQRDSQQRQPRGFSAIREFLSDEHGASA